MSFVVENDLSLKLNEIKDARFDAKRLSVTDPSQTNYVKYGTTVVGGANEGKIMGQFLIDDSPTPPAPNTLPTSEAGVGRPSKCFSYRGSNGWEYVWHYALNELNLPNADVSFGGKKITDLAEGVAPTDGVNVAQLDAAAFGLIPQDPVRAIVNAPPVTTGLPTGARFLVGTTPSGVFVGNANKIATWGGSTWSYEVPAAGWLVMSHNYDPVESTTNADPELWAYNDTTSTWKMIYNGLILSAGNGIEITAGNLIQVKYISNSLETISVPGDTYESLAVRIQPESVIFADDGLGLRIDNNTLTVYQGDDDLYYLKANVSGIAGAGAGLVGDIVDDLLTINVVAANKSIKVNPDSIEVNLGGTQKSLEVVTSGGEAVEGLVVKVDNETIEVGANGLQMKYPYSSYTSPVLQYTEANIGLLASYDITHARGTRKVKTILYKTDMITGEIVEQIYGDVSITGVNTITVKVKNGLEAFNFIVHVTN